MDWVSDDYFFSNRYDSDLSLWKANNRKHKEFLATSDAKLDSLLIGPHMWTIYNDSKSCSLATSYKIALKLTGCSDEEFTCSDGLGMTMINTIINKIVMIILILIISGPACT